MAELNN